MRFIAIFALIFICSCSVEAITERSMYGDYLLSYDKKDILVLGENHKFTHTYIANSQKIIEQGEWYFSKDSGSLISFHGQEHNYLFGMIGVRESKVVVNAHEILIQGGDGNASWFERAY